jgi:hypothetical protein
VSVAIAKAGHGDSEGQEIVTSAVGDTGVGIGPMTFWADIR